MILHRPHHGGALAKATLVLMSLLCLVSSNKGLRHVPSSSLSPVEETFTRAAVLYLSTAQLEHYIPEVKWFLRSWEMMQLHEPNHFRTDVILVVPSYDPQLSTLPCVATIRTSKSEQGQCRIVPGYVPWSERDEYILKDYNYGNSIEAITFANDSGALAKYDKILRTDIDAFLTPAFADWNPEKFVVGGGGFCQGYDTCDRLRNISLEMDLAPKTTESPVDNIGSTWYGSTDKIVECARMTKEVMEYMRVNSFTDEELDPSYGITVSDMVDSELVPI